jgi:hypothetical protein
MSDTTGTFISKDFGDVIFFNTKKQRRQGYEDFYQIIVLILMRE